jgi:pyridoxamine 5'-phosphate oxidase
LFRLLATGWKLLSSGCNRVRRSGFAEDLEIPENRRMTLDQSFIYDFAEAQDPISLFGKWLQDAKRDELNDPEAMALATVGNNGLPDARMVLLKSYDERGFVFYTNSESAKGCELAENMQAALLFHWKSLRRQVRVRGIVEKITAAECDVYFKSRPRQSRIGAWASRQSRPLESRFALEKAVAQYAIKYTIGEVPRPDYWLGYRVTPHHLEFWKDGAFRLHDRITFCRCQEAGAWRKERLYP